MDEKLNLGKVRVKLDLNQEENVIVKTVNGIVEISVSDKHRLDTLIHRDLIVGGLNGFLKELLEKSLEELKAIQQNK